MEKRPLIVVPGDNPVQLAGSPHLERLRPYGEVVLYSTSPAGDAEKLSRVRDAQVMINSRGAVKWPRHLLEQLPRLRFITVCGIGTDSIDLEAARERNIIVSNIPGQTASVVAEHALALMLAASKRVSYQTAELRAGRWIGMNNVYLRDKTAGVIGTGAIGAKMIELCRALGMRVVAWTFNPSAERSRRLGVRFLELDELLRVSDVVTIHVKLTPESHHLIGTRELSLMKAGSLLVNTARGPIVDAAALVESLRSGHLGGAGLDVYDTEPLPGERPVVGLRASGPDPAQRGPDPRRLRPPQPGRRGQRHRLPRGPPEECRHLTTLGPQSTRENTITTGRKRHTTS